MADYPASAFAPTTKNTGDTIAASHINALQAEVTAIETALLTTGLAHDLILNATKKLYLDGGSDTYIVESSANVLRTFCGGILSLEYAAGYVAVPAGNELYLDGGGDTYIHESSANVLRCISGGSGGVELTGGATAWGAVSDERVKADLVPMDRAVERLMTLRAVTGRYRSDPAGTSRAFLIAQDVQAALPEAVSRGGDGLLSLRYSDVIPLLVAGIKELAARIPTTEGAQEKR